MQMRGGMERMGRRRGDVSVGAGAQCSMLPSDLFFPLSHCLLPMRPMHPIHPIHLSPCTTEE